MGAFKKSPPSDRPETVTKDLREAVQTRLASNKAENKLANRKPGDDGYLISSNAELAKAIGMDATLLGRTIGLVHKTKSKARPVNESRFLNRIRLALGLPIPVTVQVEIPLERMDLVRALIEMPEAKFEQFAESVDHMIQRLMRPD